MIGKIKIFGFFLFVQFLAVSNLTTAADADIKAEFIAASKNSRLANEYIVVLKEGSIISTMNQKQFNPSLAVNDVATKIANSLGVEIENQYSSVLFGFSIKLDASRLDELLQQPDILYVEENQVVTIHDVNDYETYSEQYDVESWGLDRIDQQSSILDGFYRYTSSGSGVMIYVLDSGILAGNYEFDNKMINHHVFRSGNDNYGSEDCLGHGTHVAGIAAGKDYGVAKDADLWSMKVIDCGRRVGTSVVLMALETINDIAVMPSVVNISLNMGTSTAVKQAVNAIINSGIPVVVSAGNDDKDACGQVPANVTNAITVAATDANDQRSIWTADPVKESNWGSCVDIFAPGTDILSAGNEWYGDTQVKSGTSMATPFVTGAVALYLELHPDATPSEVKQALIDNSTKDIVGDAMGSPNRLLNTEFLIDKPIGEEHLSYLIPIWFLLLN